MRDDSGGREKRIRAIVKRYGAGALRIRRALRREFKRGNVGSDWPWVITEAGEEIEAETIPAYLRSMGEDNAEG